MHQKEDRGAQPPERWLKADGSTVSCTEKVKVLEENWNEVRALMQDVLDDAVLMGCTEAQVKSEYKRLIDALLEIIPTYFAFFVQKPYSKRNG